MVDHLTLGLALARTVGAILAGVLVVLAIRAWRGSKDTRMARLGIGFAFLFLSLLIEGLAFEVLGTSLVSAHLLEAGFQVVGFAVLVWALF